MPEVIILIITSCNNDDDSESIRDVGEQAIMDQNALTNYLETNFYNYEDFEGLNNLGPLDIIIDSIDINNINKVPLANQVYTKNIL